MNLLLRRALVHGVPAIVAAGAGAGATAVVTGDTSQPITLALGDSLTPRFSITTDTVLGVTRDTVARLSRIVAQRCGASHVFLRMWHGAAPILAHTLDITVPCPDTVVVPPTDTVKPPPSDTTKPPNPTGSAELPRVYLNTSMSATPSAGRTLRVPVGANLQRALDTAVAGDRILLAAGATFTGNFMVTPRTGGIAGGWITVQSDGALPPEGSRVTPAQAAAMQYPKLVSAATNPVLAVRGAASRWRFIGIEFTYATAQTLAYTMIECAYGEETSVAALPTDLIFDRVYLHGHAELDARHGIGLNSVRTAVIDSYISDIHSGFDAQAIMGWNGPGPFKIVNNYLEAAAEVINFGGAGVSIVGQNPSDIEIRRNHITKRAEWKGKWLIKNLLELKTGGRVLIEGNVMENSWPGGQVGSAFVLWSANQLGECTWCQTFDVTIQNNLVRNIASGFQLSGKGWLYPSPLMQRVTIRNNVVIGLANPTNPGSGKIFQIADGGVPNLTIEHNTIFSPNNSTLWFGGSDVSPSLIFKDNLTGGGSLQLFASDGNGLAAWSKHTSGPSVIAGNVIALAPDWYYPTANFYPLSYDAIGLVGGGSAALSVTSTIDQLALAAGSPYKGKGSDGKDPGADIAAVRAATANVVVP